jgi:hypothetical protein
MIAEYGALPWVVFPAIATAIAWLATALGA